MIEKIRELISLLIQLLIQDRVLVSIKIILKVQVKEYKLATQVPKLELNNSTEIYYPTQLLH